jgi:hypothetical protein
MRLRDRSATDLAVLGIVLIVGTILTVSAIGIALIEILHPESDTDAIIEAESEILAVLVGALVGFIGGRSLGREEGRGSPPEPEP